MAANGAWEPGRLAFSAAGRAGAPEPFSALTAEVNPIGIVKTAFGTLHFHLPRGKRFPITFTLMPGKEVFCNEHKKIHAIFNKYNKHIATVKNNGKLQNSNPG
jgi:hypothetical protein